MDNEEKYHSTGDENSEEYVTHVIAAFPLFIRLQIGLSS